MDKYAEINVTASPVKIETLIKFKTLPLTLGVSVKNQVVLKNTVNAFRMAKNVELTANVLTAVTQAEGNKKYQAFKKI
ncbi:MAG: hypothetical protein KDE33_28610 [Bacteroidetes bacterium]|nr:hypothetical protein [Bacteroidota bacterium]